MLITALRIQSVTSFRFDEMGRIMYQTRFSRSVQFRCMCEKNIAAIKGFLRRSLMMSSRLHLGFCSFAHNFNVVSDHAPQSQSVKIEPRDDAEVAERRTKLLQACNGFKDHEEHLKKFFNPPKIASMSASTLSMQFCRQFLAAASASSVPKIDC